MSQMARQREAIAAREKRETEDAAKKAKREPIQRKDAKKDGKEKEREKEVPRKEREEKAESSAPTLAKSSRSKPASSSSSKAPVKAVPAAPRKATGSVRAKPQGGPPRVNVKDLAPDMVAPVCAPLPGSPTPLAIREVPLPVSPKATGTANKEDDVEEMELDGAEVVEPAPVLEEVIAVVEDEVAEVVAEKAPIESVPEADQEVEMEEDDEPASEADLVVVAPVEELVQTPARVVSASIIDQTPVPVESIPTTLPSAGFAFHPQLAHLMALAPQPIHEVDDFLVDLSSPPAKERSTEETIERPALGERGNTHAYVSQFHQDLMMLSGL